MAISNARVLVAAIACALLVCACASRDTPADPTTQRLIGRWSQVFWFNSVSYQTAIDLEADAVVRVKVKRHAASGMTEHSGSGKWRVDGEYFVSDLDFAGPRDAVSHLEGRHRIIAVTDWQWVLEFPRGHRLTAWRYPK